MNVSLNWLKEYVDLDENIKVKEIVDKLTMTGTKVEKIEKFGEKVEKVYTARVENIVKHETNNSLAILTLNLGDKNLVAVAKIPDIEIGDIIPVALPGATIINKEVKESVVEGIESKCMVCHVNDLGLDNSFVWCKPSGLISFPKDVKIGLDVNDVLGLGDYIIEFEITPNRPDCLSVEGIANELALTFNKPCKPLWQYMENGFKNKESLYNVEVEIDTDNCTRYTMNIAQNVEVKKSAYDMQLKLIKSGIRPINNIVDITNYVMIEIGQPLHAFDFDKINTSKIKIRQAKVEEKIITLDGINRDLNSTNMVITDGKSPIAIAGIMGGEGSSIDENTKTVIIESANFVRQSIRNTSKNIMLRTDASTRYEKGLPKELTSYAMNRVCNILNTTKSGEVGNEIVDIYPTPQLTHKIKIEYEKINNIIGTDISEQQIDDMFGKINLKLEDGYAKIPYFREDLQITEDLAEEVSRIYGYDKLDSKLPDSSLTFSEKNNVLKIEDKIKEIVMSKGYNEIYTYTFFNKELLNKMMVKEDSNLRDCIKTANPLSQDFEYMRTTTTPHMLEALEKNYTKKNEEVKLFELGKVFLDSQNIKEGKLCREEQILTIGMYSKVQDYYDFKEVIENILNYYNILSNEYDILRIEDKNEYHKGVSAKIVINEEVVAEFGKLSPKLKLNYMLPGNTFIANIYFDKLVKYAKKETKFVELQKYPAVERDLSFVIDEDVLAYNIEKELKKIEYVKQVKLFDVYKGEQIQNGKKSMAYSIILRSDKKTLQEEEIVEAMGKVIDCLQNNFDSQVRS
jgi:phenylalanyl-tRNA synthetase beta chain